MRLPCGRASQTGFRSSNHCWPARDCTIENKRCKAPCQAGDAVACYTQALLLQAQPSTDRQSDELFRRACSLGHANSCTNYAAGIWAGAIPVDDIQTAMPCAERLFEKTCAVGDPFGCGMKGRLMAESADTPARVDEARKALEAWCDAPAGFACRVLALYTERGKFEPRGAARVRDLMVRACKTGDEDACGYDSAEASLH